jgi:hypothetical protein
MELKLKLNGKQKTEARGIFLNPFTVYSLCKPKTVVCPGADQETKRGYPGIRLQTA